MSEEEPSLDMSALRDVVADARALVRSVGDSEAEAAVIGNLSNARLTAFTLACWVTVTGADVDSLAAEWLDQVEKRGRLLDTRFRRQLRHIRVATRTRPYPFDAPRPIFSVPSFPARLAIPRRPLPALPDPRRRSEPFPIWPIPPDDLSHADDPCPDPPTLPAPTD